MISDIINVQPYLTVIDDVGNVTDYYTNPAFVADVVIMVICLYCLFRFIGGIFK